MTAIARLAQFEYGTTRHDFAAMAQEGLEELLEAQQLRLAVDNRDHVHAEGVLHLRHLVEVVQHHLGDFAALQFNDRAHAGFVGLVAQVRNAFKFLVAHQLGNLDQQGGLVHLVGQLVDDDRLAAAFFERLEMGARTHDHAATAGAITIANAIGTVNDAGGGKIRGLDDIDQLFDIDMRVIQNGQTGIAHIGHIVRRDIGGHADGDTAGTIDQQIRELGRQHQRLVLAAVVVRPEIDGVAIQVFEHFHGDFRHANFGIAHRRGIVAVNRSKVTLALHQWIAQREILRHAHDGVVNRGIAVRVVLAHHVADDTRRLLEWFVPVVGLFEHCKQHTAMYRLQTVTNIRKRTAHDHAHRVLEVTGAHLLFDADQVCFFGELRQLRFSHGRLLWFSYR